MIGAAHQGIIAAATPRADALWTEAAGWAVTGQSTDWGGYTWRVVVNKAAFMGSGTKIRITLTAAAIYGTYALSICRIGLAPLSGDAYDFESTPVPVLFDGHEGYAFSNGESKTSDEINLVLDGTRNLVIAGYSGDRWAGHPNLPNWNSYYKFGSDVATVNASGYQKASQGIGDGGHAVTKIEVR